MSVSTSAAFFDLLKESDILSPEELSRAENLIGEEQDTRRAARSLVKADLLTRWQASQLLKGSPLLSLGKYVLLDRLPWGSNHAVFLATHPMMDRKVALNVLDRASSNRADSRESFISDARSIAALDHRHLIHVFDIDEAEQRCFLVMEHVDGKNLHDTVKDRGPLSIELSAEIVRQIADGLTEAHKKKLIHGGLRPTNVILDDQNTAKIIDLGLSKFDDLSKRPAGKEDDSRILSIADFLSPEQARGKLPTAASDIYSLGCIAYFLLTGKAPFTGGSYTQRLQRHQHDQATDVRKGRKDVPDGLAEIVMRMMAKEPGARYENAKEIADDLAEWWNDYAATAAANKPKPAPAPSAKPAPSKKSAAPKKASDSTARPPVAAAPPPKKNGKAAAEKGSDTASAGEFPGIDVGKARPKPAAEKAAPGVASKAKQPVKDTPQKPVATVAKSTPAPSAAKPDVEEKKGLPLPLILGGVGALVLLLLLGGGGVAAYFIFGSSDDDQAEVAVADADEPAADDTDPADGTEPEDTNGEGGGEEPADAEEPNGEDTELPVPGGDEPDDGSGSEPDDNNPDQPDPPNENPDDEPKDPPVDPEPPKEPEPPKDPKPPKNGGNKPPNKPPKAQNPFKALASAVDLPPLSGEAQVASLGKVGVPEETACYIDLLGGEQVAPKSDGRFVLERARNGLADREWDLEVENDGSSVVVATMKLDNSDLQFQWTPEGVKHELSPYLSNTALNLRTADHEAYLALRTPEQVSALIVNLERPTVRQKLEIPNTPDLSTLSVEITKVDGQEKVNYVPKQVLGVAEKDSTIAWLGEAADRLMGFKVDTVMQRDLQVSMTVVVDGGAQPVAFNAKTLGQYYNQALLVQTQLGPQVEKMKKNRDKFRKELPAAEQQLSIAEQTVEKLEELKKQAEAVNGTAIHFRVFRTAGDHQIDIIQGSQVPEAPAKAE